MARSGNIVITRGTQNFVNATTPITVTGTITTTGGTYRGDHRPCTVTVKQGNNVIHSSTFTHGAPANTTTTLFSINLVVQHDANGESGVITASYDYDNGWCTAASTLSIPAIVRASTLTLVNGVLGTAQAYSITRENESYTHKIRYVCGSATGYILGSASATSSEVQIAAWRPPLDWARQNTTGSDVAVVLTLETYSGTNKIGENSYTRTFYLPDSVQPTVSLTVTDTTGHKDTYGKFIKGKSKLNIKLDAAGSYGSTVKSYKITANGKTYTQAEITTDVVAFTGTSEVTAVVVDSRGRSSAVDVETIESLDYSPPRLTNVKVFRSDSDGSANPAGTQLCARFSATVSSLSGQNTARYQIKYKKKMSLSYTTISVSRLNDVYSVVDENVVFSADINSSYDVVVSVADDFETINVAKTGPTISIHSCKGVEGNGLALGKYLERDGTFDVEWETILRNGLTVYDSEGNAHEFLDLVGKFADYLPLTGGKLSGELVVENNSLASQRTISGALKKTQFVVDSSGKAYWRFLSAGIQQNYAGMSEDLLEVGSGITADGAVTAAQGQGFKVGNAIINSSANQQLYLGASSENNYRLFYGVRDSIWTFTPSVSGNCNLGTSNYKWNQIYANNSTISTSDRNEKLEIKELDKELSTDFILAIPPKSFKMVNGSSGRTHWGMISQDVWEVMQSLGISDKDFAGYIKYHKYHAEEKEIIVVDEETNEEQILCQVEDVYEYDADGNPIYGYGLRYEEFIAPMIATIQKQQEKIEYLENEIASIKAAIGL